MLAAASHYSRKFISENTLRFDVAVDVNQGYSFEHSSSQRIAVVSTANDSPKSCNLFIPGKCCCLIAKKDFRDRSLIKQSSRM